MCAVPGAPAALAVLCTVNGPGLHTLCDHVEMVTCALVYAERLHAISLRGTLQHFITQQMCDASYYIKGGGLMGN